MGDGAEDRQLDAAGFAELCEILGEETARAMLGRLAADLRTRFTAGPEDLVRTAADAHDMASAAGLLGFVRFSEACRALEAACRAGRVEAAMLTALQAAREEILAEIAAAGDD